jgi:hypothetical protein
VHLHVSFFATRTQKVERTHIETQHFAELFRRVVMFTVIVACVFSGYTLSIPAIRVKRAIFG